MPPQGRRRRSSNNVDDAQSQEPSETPSESLEPGVPFFNTTFSTHRVSPLYIGDTPLDEQRFGALAKRLRDLLVGDVVRGVEVGLNGDDGVMARAGALEAVDLGWSSLGSILGLDPEAVDNIDGDGGRPSSRDLGSDAFELPGPPSLHGPTSRQLRRVCSRQALHVSIQYEKALCTAVLVPRLEEEEETEPEDELAGDKEEPDISRHSLANGMLRDAPVDSEHFRNLPLLLVRMPAPLRSVIIDFLSSTFDCRISPLRLSTRTLLTNLERWITIARPMQNPSTSKDVVLTLAFSLPLSGTQEPDDEEQEPFNLGLKSIDVIISPSELHRFRKEGAKSKAHNAAVGSKRKFTFGEHAAKRRKFDGNVLEEGWDWRYNRGVDGALASGTAAPYPLTEALGTSFDEHLALNLFDPRTRITKVACGGFVMSESRLKLFAPTEKDLGGESDRPVLTSQVRAVVDCLGDLLDRARARL